MITAATCSRGREEDDGGISVQTERPAESLIRMAYSLRVNSSPREMDGRKRRGGEKRKRITPEARGGDKEEERGGGEEMAERRRKGKGERERNGRKELLIG